MTFPDAAEFWNRRYEAEGYLFGTAPNVFLASQAFRLAPGMRALSIADGEGRNSVWLAQQGLAVDAFDISPKAVEKARQLARERGVAPALHVADIDSWSWGEGCYDLVAAIFIQFAGPAARGQLFRRIVEALAPGGLLILQGYRPEQLEYRTGGPPCAENMYTEALLREAFAELEILHLASHDDLVAEGSGHSGMSALIDLVARKPATAG